MADEWKETIIVYQLRTPKGVTFIVTPFWRNVIKMLQECVFRVILYMLRIVIF